MLKLSGICQEFKFKRKKLLVLNQIDFTINKESFTTVIGKSGSGKTTLLNIISGLLKPSSGSIYYEGHQVKHFFDRYAAKFRRESIGFIFQQFNLIPYYTVLENVTIPLKFTSLPLKNHMERGLALLNQLGIYDKKDHYPTLLSGGQIQRVAIARALINNPKLIIADEPTGNLDQQTAGEIIDIFLKLNQEEKMTFVIVSHDDELINKSTQTYILKNKTLTLKE